MVQRAQNRQGAQKASTQLIYHCSIINMGYYVGAALLCLFLLPDGLLSQRLVQHNGSTGPSKFAVSDLRQRGVGYTELMWVAREPSLPRAAGLASRSGKSLNSAPGFAQPDSQAPRLPRFKRAAPKLGLVRLAPIMLRTCCRLSSVRRLCTPLPAPQEGRQRHQLPERHAQPAHPGVRSQAHCCSSHGLGPLPAAQFLSAFLLLQVLRQLLGLRLHLCAR